MGLFKRISNVVKSNLNEVVSSAEDPRKLVEQAISDLQAQQKKGAQQRLELTAMLKRTEKNLQELRNRAGELEKAAMAAVQKGSDDLARKALEEQQRTLTLVEETEHSVATQRQAIAELDGTLRELDLHVAEAKRKRNELVARIAQAEMKKKTADARSPSRPGKDHIGDEGTFNTFDRMVEKIENTEAEVEAQRELAGDPGDTAKMEIDKLAGEAGAEDALAALKRKMGKS